MFFLKKKIYYPKPSVLAANGYPKLTFCMTHKNRFENLRHALHQNLSDNENNGDVDFVLVDFGADLSVVNWVRSNFVQVLKEETLKLYHCQGLPEWHASKAKNCAHALAGGDILVNLDCDNFTGKDGGLHVIKRFLEAKNNIVLWQYSGTSRDGSYGRIGLEKGTFVELGGYDESLLPMGFQDGDLINRAIALGLELKKDKQKQYNRALDHSKYVPTSMTWKNMNEQNEQQSKRNVSSGILTANGGEINRLAKKAHRVC